MKCLPNAIRQFILLLNSTNMNEDDREIFLNLFRYRNSDGVLGFCVLGGIFSEGVDLKHEGLIGSIIIGVGLPMICFERDIIRDYFNEKKPLWVRVFLFVSRNE